MTCPKQSPLPSFVLALIVICACILLPTEAFTTVSLTRSTTIQSSNSLVLYAVQQGKGGEDEEEDDVLPPKVNPYADPSYPDLEFIDYSDPNYQVDMGLGDELFDQNSANEDTTEVEVEAMREERRRRNDEFQFQTYFAKILKGGEEYKGEWTLYKTSTFLKDATGTSPEGPPGLVQASQPMYVVSRGEKKVLKDDSLSTQFPVELERILQHDRIASAFEIASGNAEELSAQARQIQDDVLSQLYGPKEMCSEDFRGPQGNMCVGNGYTRSFGVPLNGDTTTFTTLQADGPFSEYRTEVGLTTQDLRFNIKLDYAVVEEEKKKSEKTSSPPPLHLRSLIVGREMLGMWPRSSDGKSISLDDEFMATSSEALFGIPGADNGLYDPPPVGSDEQAALYLQLDLDGHATALFPYRMDQCSKVFGDFGWVVSLDWTPSQIRYQVDRKVMASTKMLGLRTLELSEVQAASAETYRPKGPREDMRQ